MRLSLLFVLTIIAPILVAGQDAPRPATTDQGSNLPARPISPNDLISVSVYGAPELSRTIRVGADGGIRLPIVKGKLKAEGLLPADLETSIASELVSEHLLKDPFVTVTVSEYNSHPISVSGAVKKPTVLQASTPVTLRDALARAEGLREDAGREIVVTRARIDENGKPLLVTEHIPSRSLMDGSDPALNLLLTGGEDVLVPVVEKIYVVGNVRRSGAYPVQNAGDTSVLKMLALAEGLSSFYTNEAYIYRTDAAGAKTEIPVPLAKIMQRKSPDITLVANDILYVPDNKRKRMAATVVDRIAGAASMAASTSLIYR